MSNDSEITNLEQLLDRIAEAEDQEERVSLGSIVETIGSRSFGPLLLLAGVVLASPLSGIPGMPSAMGLLVLLIAAQLLFRRDHFWLPQWLLKRSVSRDRLHQALGWVRPPSRLIDRWLRPRLTLLVGGIGRYVVAVLCIVIAAATPVLELAPFSATGAGIALTVFGLSLIAHDGLLALVAYTLALGTLGLAVYYFV